MYHNSFNPMNDADDTPIERDEIKVFCFFCFESATASVSFSFAKARVEKRENIKRIPIIIREIIKRKGIPNIVGESFKRKRILIIIRKNIERVLTSKRVREN